MRDMIFTASQEGHPHKVMMDALRVALDDAIAHRDAQVAESVAHEAAAQAVRNIVDTMENTFGLSREFNVDPDDWRSPRVRAYRPNPDSMFGTNREAEVNWSALGSVSTAEARAYAQLILRAADWAEGLG